jgi:hypothetical protein
MANQRQRPQPPRLQPVSTARPTVEIFYSPTSSSLPKSPFAKTIGGVATTLWTCLAGTTASGASIASGGTTSDEDDGEEYCYDPMSPAVMVEMMKDARSSKTPKQEGTPKVGTRSTEIKGKCTKH